MWSPLHFAVYHGNLDMVKLIIEQLGGSMRLNFRKPLYENEAADFTSENFAEDKVFLLLLAYDRGDINIVHYLLDVAYKWLPKIAFEKILDNLKKFVETWNNWDPSFGERP